MTSLRERWPRLWERMNWPDVFIIVTGLAMLLALALLLLLAWQQQRTLSSGGRLHFIEDRAYRSTVLEDLDRIQGELERIGEQHQEAMKKLEHLEALDAGPCRPR